MIRRRPEPRRKPAKPRAARIDETPPTGVSLPNTIGGEANVMANGGLRIRLEYCQH